jgi:hypothetical protein
MQISSIAKAARMLISFGVITLVLDLIIGFALMIPTIQSGATLERHTITKIAIGVIIAMIYVIVGSFVKRNGVYSRRIGVVFSLLALLVVPLGTLFGALALLYLFKGRHDPVAGVSFPA